MGKFLLYCRQARFFFFATFGIICLSYTIGLGEGSMSGKELLKLRDSVGWSQREFAERLGITANSFARLERGVRFIQEPTARLARIVVELELKGVVHGLHTEKAR